MSPEDRDRVIVLLDEELGCQLVADADERPP